MYWIPSRLNNHKNTQFTHVLLLLSPYFYLLVDLQKILAGKLFEANDPGVPFSKKKSSPSKVLKY